MESPTLYYVTDPLCIWCYGFAPELTLFKSKIPNDIKTITIHGGLFPNEKARQANKEFRNYLKVAATRVTSMTRQIFTDKFWQRLASPGFMYDTEPPALASFIVGHEINQQAILPFMELLQKKVFIEGYDPTNLNDLTSIAKEMNVNEERFRTMFTDTYCLQQLRKQYQFAKTLGAQSYPSLILVKNNTAYSVGAGYNTHEKLLENLYWALDSNPKST